METPPIELLTVEIGPPSQEEAEEFLLGVLKEILDALKDWPEVNTIIIS